MTATAIFKKPATVKHNGTRYALGTLEQMLGIEAEMLARPGWRQLLACKGCTRDNFHMVCTHESPCICCEFRKRDNRTYVNEHFALMTVEEFRDRLRAFEAAVNA